MPRILSEADWHYPPELPVVGCRQQILNALRQHDVVVVVSETGSGKTTQLPKMVAEVLQEIYADKMRLIAVTQPRRIAAVSVARRVAEEIKLPLGDYVGYQVRFDDKRSAATRIKFMTDGILLAETQGDPNLSHYDAILLDEAHERSLNIDFLLGYLRQLRKSRPNLKIVISSATLDAGAFAEFFRDGEKEVPVIVSEGRTFPVDEIFLPPDEDEDPNQHIARAVDSLTRRDPAGDILIFLPGEKEIRDCADALEGRNYPRTEVLPLFARLGMADQQRIFSPGPLRRIILATNVAETSLTIPRITSVVDTGLARISRWSPTRGVQRLQIEPVSKASARQRKGRCGRVKAGTCVRLFSEDDFAERPEFTDPEIRRSSLAGVILRMISLGLPDIDEFPLIDPPTPKAISEGYRTLREVGAITKERKLTDDGSQMARMPVDPRLARMLLAAREENVLNEMLPVIAALESQDPRERPAEKAKEADAAHARWKHPSSDFLTLLRIWLDLARFRENEGKNRNLNWRRNALRKFTSQTFLSFRRVLEWANVHDELRELLERELRWQIPPPRTTGDANAADFQALHDPFHRALLAGAPRQFALWDIQENIYRIGSGGTCSLFPGSALFGGKRFDWLLVMEVVETSRLFARRAARLDPAWIEQVAPHLCSYRYSHGAWDIAQGAVYAKETVLCGGMVIAKDRRVHLGRIDLPAAREIFIREALIQHAITSPCPSLTALKKLKEQVTALEVKLRRPDHFWSEDNLFAFFNQHIPAGMCTAKAFHDWRATNEKIITPTLADVVWDIEALGQADDFPDTLHHADQEYSIYYAMAPGAADDGVTIGIHIDQLADFPDILCEWGVPGHLPERVEFLVRRLPKDLRKACQPIATFVDDFCDLWARAPKTISLRTALADAVRARVRYHVPESDIELDSLPAEWIVKCWICDDDGNELAIGKNPAHLREKLQSYLRDRLIEHANADWHSQGHTTWPIDLPREVPSTGGTAYPGLLDEGKSIAVTASHCPHTATYQHRIGCSRLLMLTQPDQVAYLTKNYPIGLAARVELPRIGTGGTPMDHLLLLAAEGALGATMPRSEKEFLPLVQKARGDWHHAAKPIGQALDAIVAIVPPLRDWCQAQKNHPHLAEIADDEEQHLAWLLRHSFALRASYPRLIDYPRFLRGIQVRLDRLKSLPIVKDLEKMDRVRALWVPWHEKWQRDPENPTHWEAGWHLEEYRLSLLSPGIPTKGNVSEKKLREL